MRHVIVIVLICAIAGAVFFFETLPALKSKKDSTYEYSYDEGTKTTSDSHKHIQVAKQINDYNDIRLLLVKTIEESYKSGPFKQTTFDPLISTLDAETVAYLFNVFQLTDIMVSARVSVLTNLYYGRGGLEADRYSLVHKRVMGKLDELTVPKKLGTFHNHITHALREQGEFVNLWDKTNDKEEYKKTYFRHELVRSSHQKLLGAYRELMSLFPRENMRNKTSFYDHLCALDFI